MYKMLTYYWYINKLLIINRSCHDISSILQVNGERQEKLRKALEEAANVPSKGGGCDAWGMKH